MSPLQKEDLLEEDILNADLKENKLENSRDGIK